MPYKHMPCLRHAQEQNEQKEQKGLRKDGLTPRQQEALDSFRAIVKRNKGVPPSIEELAQEMGVKKATAQGFLVLLVRKGFLVKRGCARSSRNLCVVRGSR